MTALDFNNGGLNLVSFRGKLTTLFFIEYLYLPSNNLFDF